MHFVDRFFRPFPEQNKTALPSKVLGLLVHTPTIANNGGTNEPAPVQLHSLYYETGIILRGISFALRKIGLFFTIMLLIMFAILFSNLLFLV